MGTDTPTEAFVDPGSRDERTCASRLPAFNRHCIRSDGVSVWGPKPQPQPQPQPITPQCWMTMPTGCDRKLSETDTPTEAFVDPGSRDERTCASRLPAFNRHCIRSDGVSVWGPQPQPQPTTPQCWMTMPTGCDRELSETDTPTEAFVDPGSRDERTCASRLPAFNRHCIRSDGVSV